LRPQDLIDGRFAIDARERDATGRHSVCLAMVPWWTFASWNE